MITQIGITAGTIWEVLDKNSEIELSSLYEHLNDTPEMILMSLGWLVREGHVALEEEESTCKVYLRDRRNTSEGKH